MTADLDETHDPSLTSWVEAANDPATDFPIQNLPFGRFRGERDAQWIVASGQSIRRPSGRVRSPGDEVPRVGPTQRLDFELELGAFIGTANSLGEPVDIAIAEDHLFGVALFNDWTARDIQAWEYQPLGPFLSKNFASTLSPWMVTLEALQPFRCAFTRPDSDPDPLPYLDSPPNRASGAIDIELEV